jgi:hypothetical protein
VCFVIVPTSQFWESPEIPGRFRSDVSTEAGQALSGTVRRGKIIHEARSCLEITHPRWEDPSL